MPAPIGGIWRRRQSSAPGAILTARGAQWRSNGTAQDRVGNVIANGLTLGEHLGGSGVIAGLYTEFGAGGDYDTARKELLLILAGGDQGWSSFEINALNAAVGAWNTSGARPQDPYTRLLRQGNDNFVAGEYGGGSANSPDFLLDPSHLYDSIAKVDTGLGVRIFPLAQHTANSICYMPSVGRFFHYGGFANYWAINGSMSIPMEWDPVSKQWEGISQDAIPGWRGNITQMTWDSKRLRVLIYNGRYLYAYDPTAPKGSRMRFLYDFGVEDQNNAGALCFNPDVDHALYIDGRFAQSFYWDFSATPNAPTVHNVGLSASLPGIKLPGLRYDPISGVYVFWGGNKTVYFIEAPAYTVTSLTPAGGGDPGANVFGNSGPGGYGTRFFHMPDEGTFGVTTSVDENGFSVFVPVRLAPYIESTDIIAGPNLGNSDTSRGQTINVDGALVTLYGMFGGLTPEDELSVTVNGANALIYDYGQCRPPRCPATMYNTYQRYEQITVQVPHTASAGLGSIVVTVNGVASVGTPFTVQSGQVYFVAPGGSDGAQGRVTTPWQTIQHALDTMVPGDILYVRDGVNEAGGASPNNGATPTAYTAILAYPGAVVTVGSATQGSFPLIHSGSGRYMVYGGLRLFGTTAAPAVITAGLVRMAGCLVQAPNANGSTGAVGTPGGVFIDSSAFDVVCNEFTNCGLDPTDNQFHVLYLAGIRGYPAPYIEGSGQSRRVVGNYFHDNNGFRAINIYNGNGFPNPITGHYVARNVIVDQNRSGILFSIGVVGENWCIGNLLIRAGKIVAPSGSQDGAGLWGHMGWVDGLGVAAFPDGSFPKAATVLHAGGNTFVDCGDAAAGTASGAWLIDNLTYWTPDMHGSLIYQSNGQPYVASGSEALATNAAQSSKNLWFGNGAPPAFDTSPLNVDPQFVGGGNYRLKAISPARAAGSILGTSIDIDGNVRPSATAWDLGAYQFGSAPASGPPPPPPPAHPIVNVDLTQQPGLSARIVRTP